LILVIKADIKLTSSLKNIIEKKNHKSSNGGYILIELIVVCAIIGILATMAVALLSRAKIGARESAALVTLNSFAGAYESYWSRNGVYPQWGPGMPYDSPDKLFHALINEGYLPKSYSTIPYVSGDKLFFWLTDDYALEIFPFDSKNGTRDPSNYYWLLFHPRGFQSKQGFIGIGTTPLSGKSTIRPRVSTKPGDIESFTIYGLHHR